MKTEEAKRIAMGLRTDFKCESDIMVDFCNTIIKALEQVPCEDAISKKAVLALAKEECDTAIIPYRKFVKDVNALPPVTLPNSKMEQVEDCISRAQALKEADQLDLETFYDNEKVEKMLKSLPPVTPQPMKEKWQELKETIIEMRDNDGTGTQQETCKFLANLMDVLEEQMEEKENEEQRDDIL